MTRAAQQRRKDTQAHKAISKTNEQYTFELSERSAYPVPRAFGRRDQDHLCTVGQTNVQRVDRIKNEPIKSE
jgi:hypothetical protein